MRATVALRRGCRRLSRRLREVRLVARALASAHHPVLAQIVPIRRCNLSCAYCNEFDAHSHPVPTPQMLARIDRLAALKTTMIDLSGGEPLLHPDLDAIIRRIREHGIFAGLLTNAYLLTAERIDRLNRAGLDHLQISIDNLTPDGVSKKSLEVLDRRLELLARHATFHVNINTVMGGELRNSGDALIIARRAIELGFTATVGLVHAPGGRLIALDAGQRRTYEEVQRLITPFYSAARHTTFQRRLVRGEPNAWQCRAGARYLYVCEDGLVHWCSQQRGYPAIPLERYGEVDLARESHTVKSCAPYCTISCVHRVALLDALRERPAETLAELLSPGAGSPPPATARLLRWLFVTGPPHRLFRSAAARLLGAR